MEKGQCAHHSTAEKDNCTSKNSVLKKYLQNRSRLTDMENRLAVAKGEGVGRGTDWECGVSRCKPSHLEWINNKVLLYSNLLG